MHKKNNLFIIIVIFLLALLLVNAVHFLFYTQLGSNIVSRLLLRYLSGPADIKVEKIEGIIAEKFSLHNVHITNIKKFPKDSEIKIQRLDLSIKKFKLSSVYLNVYNGRINLAFSDSILFYGEYKDKNFNLKLYCKRVSAREIIDLFTRRPVLSTLRGVIRDVNIKFSGKNSEIIAEGKFYVENINKERFSMNDCKGSLLMYCDNLFDSAQLTGEIFLRGGNVSGGKTALIELSNSKIIFEGDPKIPKLNIRGSAKVEEVYISMVLQGTVDNPKLTLSSNPSLTEDVLLVMLATGRAWTGTQSTMNQGRMSADLVKDFVDYFILSGTGSKIARRFGISNISLIYDDTTNTMGVSTSFVDKMKVGYEVTAPKNSDKSTETATTVHTVKGEMKITNKVSLGAEKEVTKSNLQKQLEQEEAESKKGEEKVYLKYKQKF